MYTHTLVNMSYWTGLIPAGVKSPYSSQVTTVTVLGRGACVGDGDSSALRGKSVRASFNSHYTFTFFNKFAYFTLKTNPVRQMCRKSLEATCIHLNINLHISKFLFKLMKRVIDQAKPCPPPNQPSDS